MPPYPFLARPVVCRTPLLLSPAPRRSPPAAAIAVSGHLIAIGGFG